MHIKNIHCILEKLVECARVELDKGINCISTEEFGDVVDMIRDLSEAEYKAIIVREMNEQLEEGNRDFDEERRSYDNYRYKTSGRFAPKGKGSYAPRRGSDEAYYHMTPEMYREWEKLPSGDEWMRDMDKSRGRMYYTESAYSNKNDAMARDRREGKSALSRRNYMESKELHKGNSQQDKEAKMKELEIYLKELSEDVTEMLADMSPEERTLAKTKLSTLVTKM